MNVGVLASHEGTTLQSLLDAFQVAAFSDAEYDSGAIVRQCSVPVFRGESLDDLKARVRAREKEFVVERRALPAAASSPDARRTSPRTANRQTLAHQS
jgi:folate-dependent phosphoribosylglycinamide formyltransferase PurN